MARVTGHPCGNEAQPQEKAMDTFRAHYADLRDPDWEPRIAARLRDHGLVTFSGITSRAALVAVARQLMTILSAPQHRKPHAPHPEEPVTAGAKLRVRSG
jgi:hypothetical protein